MKIEKDMAIMLRRNNRQRGEVITMMVIITLAPVILGATYGFVTDTTLFNDEKTGVKVVRTYVTPSEYNIRVFDGHSKNVSYAFKDEAEAKAFAQQLSAGKTAK